MIVIINPENLIKPSVFEEVSRRKRSCWGWHVDTLMGLLDTFSIQWKGALEEYGVSRSYFQAIPKSNHSVEYMQLYH